MWMIWVPLTAVASAVVVTSALIAIGLYDGYEGATFLGVIEATLVFELPILIYYFLAGLLVALIARLLPRKLPFAVKVTLIGVLGVSMGIALVVLYPPAELSIRDSGVHLVIIYVAVLVGLLSWKRAGYSK